MLNQGYTLIMTMRGKRDVTGVTGKNYRGKNCGQVLIEHMGRLWLAKAAEIPACKTI